MKVKDIQNEEFIFVNTDYEVRELKKLLGIEEDFDALFVKIKDGDIIEAYGVYGIPHLNKEVVKIKEA